LNWRPPIAQRYGLQTSLVLGLAIGPFSCERKSEAAMRNIILIHGAFHTRECWHLLAPVLETRGFRVSAPTLRGQPGNPRNPLLVSWNTYAEDIIQCAEQNGSPSILLGHSLAGFAISAAAERRPDLFSRLIYLAAAVPKLGRSSVRDAVAEPQKGAPRPNFGIRMTFPKDKAGETFYQLCTPDVREQAVAALVPQPLRPFLSKVKLTQTGVGSVPKHFIACAEDRVIPIGVQRQKLSNLAFDSVETLQADHSPFLSDPHSLADCIERISGTDASV
jgi:pimeloyl-ACP methyl ester carboxylesterase